jgi:hypothetical protein
MCEKLALLRNSIQLGVGSSINDVTQYWAFLDPLLHRHIAEALVLLSQILDPLGPFHKTVTSFMEDPLG